MLIIYFDFYDNIKYILKWINTHVCVSLVVKYLSLKLKCVIVSVLKSIFSIPFGSPSGW